MDCRRIEFHAFAAKKYVLGHTVLRSNNAFMVGNEIVCNYYSIFWSKNSNKTL